MTEETTESATDFLEEMDQDEYQGPSAMAAPHELGGIRLLVRSREEDGVKLRETRLDISEAAMLATHLQALITLAFNTVYAQQAAMAQQVAPPQNSGLWKPGR